MYHEDNTNEIHDYREELNKVLHGILRTGPDSGSASAAEVMALSLSLLQTCLKESDSSDTEDLGSEHSEDCLSEASWEPIDKKETEVCAAVSFLSQT